MERTAEKIKSGRWYGRWKELAEFLKTNPAPEEILRRFDKFLNHVSAYNTMQNAGFSEDALNVVIQEVLPTVEKRKTFERGEQECPKCGSQELEYEDAPNHVTCESCGGDFRIEMALVWNEKGV